MTRDRPFLVAYWLIERAVSIVRTRWPTRGLTNREISRKYSSHWQKILQKAYPQVPGITARLCRRFFAVYSFHYFGKSVFIGGESQASLNGYASWVLGHATLEDHIRSLRTGYSSLIVRPMPKLKLFEIGANLKVVEAPPAKNPSKQRQVSGTIKAERWWLGAVKFEIVEQPSLERRDELTKLYITARFRVLKKSLTLPDV